MADRTPPELKPPQQATISYFGFNDPACRRFVMPASRYEVEIIDTWNMIVETQPGTVEGRFRLGLPGRQFIAVRIRAAS